MANIMLIYPPELVSETLTNSAVGCQSLGIYYLASCLRASGHHVSIADSQVENLDLDRVASRALNSHYDLIGISMSSQHNLQDGQIVIEYLREKGIGSHITVGGHYPTFEARSILEHIPTIDSVIRGEGENTLVELVQRIETGKSLQGLAGLTFRLNGEIIDNEDRPVIADLDSISFPARDVIDLLLVGNDYVQVSAQRGCYGLCTYCSIHSFYGNSVVRRRSPQNVANELEMLVSTYGAQRISFVDDEFADRSIASRRWIKELTSEIKIRNLDIEMWIQIRATDFVEEVINPLLEVGLRQVFIGVESINQNVLNRFNKKVKKGDNLKAIALAEKLGLIQQIGFIMFEPYMSIDDLRDHYQWLRHYKYREPVHYYTYVLPYAGTPLRARLLREGRLNTQSWHDVGTYEFVDPQVGAVFGMMQSLMPQITEIESSFDRSMVSCRRAMDRIAGKGSVRSASCRTSVRALRRFESDRRTKMQAIMGDIFEKILVAIESGNRCLTDEYRRELEETARSFSLDESCIERESAFASVKADS